MAVVPNVPRAQRPTKLLPTVLRNAVDSVGVCLVRRRCMGCWDHVPLVRICFVSHRSAGHRGQGRARACCIDRIERYRDCEDFCRLEVSYPNKYGGPADRCFSLSLNSSDHAEENSYANDIHVRWTCRVRIVVCGGRRTRVRWDIGTAPGEHTATSSRMALPQEPMA
jgi:hypothetical protein